MEYCPVGSVGDIMHLTQKGLNEEQIRYVIKCTLKGLAYLHAHRKIHRDIKPGSLPSFFSDQKREPAGERARIREAGRLWSQWDPQRKNQEEGYGHWNGTSGLPVNKIQPFFLA